MVNVALIVVEGSMTGLDLVVVETARRSIWYPRSLRREIGIDGAFSFLCLGRR